MALPNDTLGLSFAPNQQQPGGPGGQKPGGMTPVQEAIRTIGLRVPRTVGARAIAPSPLMHAAGAGGFATGLGGLPGASGLDPGMGLEELLRKLFGLGGGSDLGAMGDGSGGGAGAPPPRIIPGINPTDGIPPIQDTGDGEWFHGGNGGNWQPPPTIEPRPGLDRATGMGGYQPPRGPMSWPPPAFPKR